MMNFIEGETLLIDKNLDWTSFDVVNKIRFLISKNIGKRIKVGHAGTLDPKATGLLIICTGKKTKTIENIQVQNKRYVAELKIGATTASFDIETLENQVFETKHISKELIESTLKNFIGEQEQTPPMFSAIKVNGKRAYKLARMGKEVEIKAKTINISSIELINYQNNILKLDIKCSKGTYIRSFARDFGKALNCGAYLLNLRRTEIGYFSIENAQTVSEFETFIKNNINYTHEVI